MTLHGITSGSDTAAPWATWAYLVPTAAAVFLLVYRVVVSVAQRPGARTAGSRLAPGRQLDDLTTAAPSAAGRGALR